MREFIDVDTLHGSSTWSLWDYWSTANIVVLFTTQMDRIGYATLQRATGQVAQLPAEPVLSPDRQRVAVADFCPANCDNELTVWRIARNGIHKERTWKPEAAWSDVTVQWRDDQTLAVEYTKNGDDKARTLVRRLDDAQWRQVGTQPAP